MLQNQDVVKGLRVGMLIAIAGDNFPRVGEVVVIPPNVSFNSFITVQWMVQERAAHKPKWQRGFKVPAKKVREEMMLNRILLYGFQLTNNGCLKKKSRDYLRKTLNI